MRGLMQYIILISLLIFDPLNIDGLTESDDDEEDEDDDADDEEEDPEDSYDDGKNTQYDREDGNSRPSKDLKSDIDDADDDDKDDESEYEGNDDEDEETDRPHRASEIGDYRTGRNKLRSRKFQFPQKHDDAEAEPLHSTQSGDEEATLESIMCYSCKYVKEAANFSERCLDPVKNGFVPVRCDPQQQCFTERVGGSEQAPDTLVRGCRDNCVDLDNINCCNTHRCNGINYANPGSASFDQDDDLDVRAPSALSENKQTSNTGTSQFTLCKTVFVIQAWLQLNPFLSKFI